jgi:hypothetical protein
MDEPSDGPSGDGTSEILVRSAVRVRTVLRPDGPPVWTALDESKHWQNSNIVESRSRQTV